MKHIELLLEELSHKYPELKKIDESTWEFRNNHLVNTIRTNEQRWQNTPSEVTWTRDVDQFITQAMAILRYKEFTDEMERRLPRENSWKEFDKEMEERRVTESGRKRRVSLSDEEKEEIREEYRKFLGGELDNFVIADYARNYDVSPQHIRNILGKLRKPRVRNNSLKQ